MQLFHLHFRKPKKVNKRDFNQIQGGLICFTHLTVETTLYFIIYGLKLVKWAYVYILLFGLSLTRLSKKILWMASLQQNINLQHSSLQVLLCTTKSSFLVRQWQRVEHLLLYIDSTVTKKRLIKISIVIIF